MARTVRLALDGANALDAQPSGAGGTQDRIVLPDVEQPHGHAALATRKKDKRPGVLAGRDDLGGFHGTTVGNEPPALDWTFG